MRKYLLGLSLVASSTLAVMAAPPTGAQKDEFYAVCVGISQNAELCRCKADAAMTLIDERFMGVVIASMKGGSPAAALPYRPWQFARMAAGILDELGYSEVDVMGVSWGGAMAPYRDRNVRHWSTPSARNPGIFVMLGGARVAMAVRHLGFTGRDELARALQSKRSADGWVRRREPSTRLSSLPCSPVMFASSLLTWLDFVLTA